MILIKNFMLRLTFVRQKKGTRRSKKKIFYKKKESYEKNEYSMIRVEMFKAKGFGTRDTSTRKDECYFMINGICHNEIGA